MILRAKTFKRGGDKPFVFFKRHNHQKLDSVAPIHARLARPNLLIGLEIVVAIRVAVFVCVHDDFLLTRNNEVTFIVW